MSKCRWLFFSFIILLSACKGELQPNLELEGHWIVDHGLDDGCQVGASFTHNIFALTFYSLKEGACQPEHYGIQEDALLISITSKKDYFNDGGALATELQVLESERFFKATLRLTETASGLTGSIVSVQNDPDDLLKPLLEPTYTLTRVPEDWFSLLRGSWGLGCDPVEASGQCRILEFNSTLIGRYSDYEGCYERLKCERLQQSSEFVIGLRNVKPIAEGKYQLDLVIFGPGSDGNPPGSSGTLLLSKDSLELVGEGRFNRLVNRPVVSK
jgi:hypothetical protein